MEKVEKYVVNKRHPYCGVTITPQNRRKYLEQFKQRFLDNASEEESFKDLSEEEKLETAEIYAKLEVQREQKHLKAWLRAQKGYKFKGKYFPVLKPQIEEEIFHSQIQKERELELENNKTEEE